MAIAGVCACASAAILGPDDRVVDDGARSWTSAVGYITPAQPFDGDVRIGTAFVVGPRVVLANWHTLHDDNGALLTEHWVYVRDGKAHAIRVLPHFQFTLMGKADLPLRAASRRNDVIALILAEPVAAPPLVLRPLPVSRLPASGEIGDNGLAMAGVSLTYANELGMPRTLQQGCAFASLAANAQFPNTPGLIGHTCDVWPGDSGAPLVEERGGETRVHAINSAHVIPGPTRERYEERKRKGEIIPPSLSDHINIGILVTDAMVSLVAKAARFASTLPAVPACGAQDSSQPEECLDQ